MDAPKHKPSILLPTLGLFSAVVARMALELFVPRPRNAIAERSGQRPSSDTPFRNGNTSDALHQASSLTREQRIRDRAFQIWLDEGKPDGRHQEHWRMAEAEIVV